MTLIEAAGRLQQAAIALKKRREKDALARKHQRKIAAFFRSQKVATLAALAEQEWLFSESYRRLTEETTQLTLAQWGRIWEKVSADTISDLQKVVFNAEVDGVVAGAEQLKKQIPIRFDKVSSFNLANPRAVKWFSDTGGSVDYITGIQRATGEQVRSIISKALDGGWTYSKTAKEISDRFDGMSRARAQRIAVYETGSAYEQGNMLFAQSLKSDGVVMEKMWQTSEDDRVRQEHWDNQNEGWIPIDQYHRSGHQEPPTDPGCRCYEIYQEAPARL
jgi:uncharacterized protein with gpF-like domain